LSARRPVTADAPRILVVDDEPDNCELLELLLAWEGFAVVTACGGAEALALVAQQPPDLILLDVMMPGMTGFEVVATLKGQPGTKHIPVIMVTAMEDPRARAEGVGADGFLRKPLDREDLVRHVRQLLASPGSAP
jgi:CheY-like chemotaxis protein